VLEFDFSKKNKGLPGNIFTAPVSTLGAHKRGGKGILSDQ
jgi:hypothetical protein